MSAVVLRRIMTLTLTLCLAVSSAPALARPASGATPFPHGSLPSLLDGLAAAGAGPQAVHAAVHAARARQLEALGGLVFDGEAVAAGEYPCGEWVAPAGDFDGDGKADAYSVVCFEDVMGDYRLELRGRRGVDGHVLWQQHMDNGLFGVVPARVGLDGAPGLLVFSFEEAYTDDPPVYHETTTLTVRGIGNDGTQLWLRDFRGDLVYAASQWTMTGMPVLFEQDFNAVAGLATEVLVSTFDAVSPAADHMVGTAHVIDGGTGVSAWTSRRMADGYPQASAAPDLDGDGLDDLLWDLTWPDLHVIAERGYDGAQLWEANYGEIDWPRVPQDLGDLDGDGAAELLISAGISGFDQPFAVVNGATGQVRFDGDATRVYAAGDIDGDSHADVGIIAAAQDGRSALTLRDAAGKVLLDAPLNVNAVPSGDVNGDGLMDLHGVTIDWDTGEVGDEIISGRDGSRMWDAQRAPEEGVYALWYPTEGRSHDLLRVQRRERGSVVTVASAADGSARWRRDVPLGGVNYLVTPVNATDYDGDGITELVLASVDLSGESRQMVFSGRDGTLLWQT